MSDANDEHTGLLLDFASISAIARLLQSQALSCNLFLSAYLLIIRALTLINSPCIVSLWINAFCWSKYVTNSGLVIGINTLTLDFGAAVQVLFTVSCPYENPVPMGWSIYITILRSAYCSVLYRSRCAIRVHVAGPIFLCRHQYHLCSLWIVARCEEPEPLFPDICWTPGVVSHMPESTT
ncbi:hypothetical protein APHAL10511_007281 [Amanita phalloides]|nr:hypothetical protein APHAL10511_007281 [Amanita phalloides]